jgi:hypothetical protein
MPLQLFMGILALLTYLYETPAGACLGYLILQTFCLILQISSRNPPFDPPTYRKRKHHAKPVRNHTLADL